MEHTEVLAVLSWLPAFFVVAIDLLAYLLLVLSKVQALGWEHLRANAHLKVFI